MAGQFIRVMELMVLVIFLVPAAIIGLVFLYHLASDKWKSRK